MFELLSSVENQSRGLIEESQVEVEEAHSRDSPRCMGG